MKEFENEEKKFTNNLTELVFVLDKSGSMAGLENDTVGGFNAMINQQKEEEGKAYVSTILFSTYSTVLHDRVDVNEVLPMTKKDYRVGGCTALLDAIGDAIKHVANIHKYGRREDVPQRTIFVITTDGMENASQKYTSGQIKEMISRQEKEFGWEFLFVADNIDAVETAERIGIKKERATNYNVKEDTELMFNEIGNTIASYRKTGKIEENWAKNLQGNEKKDKTN
ncbi:MAG: VWA domain-containing protein [Clostridia bacterium]|nr:VWA domain-containing protein [Clostridia bacterium]